MKDVHVVVSRNARMDLEFPPDWRVLRELRTFVTRLVYTVAENDELAERVSMAVTELTENAVKYSVNEDSIVRLRVVPTAHGIRCETENEATPENIRDLQKAIARINVGNSLEAYVRALSDASSSEHSTSSKVGLARIRHEGGMSISCEVNGNHVKITADMARLPGA